VSSISSARRPTDVSVAAASAQQEHSKPPVEGQELARILFVALAAAVGFGVWEPFPKISVIGLAAALLGGYPIFKIAMVGDGINGVRRSRRNLAMTSARLQCFWAPRCREL
jgi:hypothetical protein